MNMEILRTIPQQVQRNQPVAIDSEWFGLNSKQMHRPTSGKFACLTICLEPGTVHLIQDPNDVPLALEAINDGLWIIQNAKFDITQLRRLATIPPRNRIVDTMLMERILYGGYYHLFGLDRNS